MDDLDAVLWEADPRTFQFTAVSAGAERLFGYPAAQWLSEPDFWREHIHPEDREQAEVLCRIAVEQRRDHQIEYRMIAANGAVRWVHDIVKVTVDGAREVTRLRGLIIDLTERRAADDVLRERELLLRTVFDSSSLGIALWSIDGRVLKANRAFANMLGFSVRELVAGTPPAFMHPEDGERMVAARAELLSGKKTSSVFEQRYLHRDGSIVFALVTLSLISVSGRPTRHFVTQLVDVTERKSIEAQYQHAQQMELLGRMAGGIAHDFSNLLTVIGNCADLLLPTLKADDPRREDVEQILSSTGSARELTKQLLALGRRPAAERGPIDLNRAVGALYRLLARGIGEHIDVVAALTQEPINVAAAVGQIEQIVLNLVFNARDAMPKGGRITLSTSVEHVAERRVMHTGALEAGEYAKIEVRDTGVGMNECTRQRIFEPFFTTKEPGQGTGLGLATVDGIVRQCGGAMHVHTAPGRGTRFEILLPRLEDAGADPSPAK